MKGESTSQAQDLLNELPKSRYIVSMEAYLFANRGIEQST